MFRWTVHLNGGPRTSVYAAVAVQHKVYAFGWLYVGGTAQIDVRVLNTVSLRWRKLTLVTTGREHHLEHPSKFQGHSAVLIEDIIYILGGYENYYERGYRNVLYAFDVDTHRWFKPMVSGTVPEVKGNHLACVLGKVMYLFGRYSRKTTCVEDIYKLDTTTMVWSLINTRGTAPPDTEYHSATIIGTKMFVLWSWGGTLFHYDQIGVFDTETNCWLSTSSAQRKLFLVYSIFTFNGKLYVFGNGDEYYRQGFSDLQEFNPETLSWKGVEPKGKGPGSMYSKRCCTVGDRIILLGCNRLLDDLYILDLRPSLKTLCKLSVIQYGLEMTELPHDIRWELAAMTTNSN